jgi:hypothetical protein
MKVLKFAPKAAQVPIIPAGFRVVKCSGGYEAQKRILFWWAPIAKFISWHRTYERACEVCILENEHG